MNDYDLFFRFASAVAIGFLIGLQRSHDKGNEATSLFAGVRTFALLSLIGAVGAYLAEIQQSDLIFITTLLLAGLFILLGYWATARQGEVGMTTEVAALLAVLLGALSYWGDLPLAAAIGVTTMVLLSFKEELHRFAQKITQEDLFASLKFAVITAIILPVLPNQTFGPLDVLNPYKIWLMVVFISGMNFLGYILIKMIGSRRGISLTGLLGGMVSSTAVTLTFSQRSQKEPTLVKPFALAIMLSWSVMFARVLLEVGVIHAPLLTVMWLPIGLTGAATAAFCFYLYFAPKNDQSTNDMEFANPFELGPAIQFALLYGVILFVAKAAQTYLGETGTYLSSIAAGLNDVDAITLSLSELAGNGDISFGVAGRAIMFAVLSNTMVKGGIVLSTAHKELRQLFWPGFVLILIVGFVSAFLQG